MYVLCLRLQNGSGTSICFGYVYSITYMSQSVFDLQLTYSTALQIDEHRLARPCIAISMTHDYIYHVTSDDDAKIHR